MGSLKAFTFLLPSLPAFTGKRSGDPALFRRQFPAPPIIKQELAEFVAHTTYHGFLWSNSVNRPVSALPSWGTRRNLA